MAWADLVRPGVAAHTSDAETARFGVGVDRVTLGTPDPGRHGAEFARAVRESTAQVVVARWPAGWPGGAAALARSGRTVLPAGALSYWGAGTGRILERCPSDPALRAVTHTGGSADPGAAAVVEVVEGLVADSFAGYGNHYSVNPLLDPDAALAGYLEWARGSLRAGDGAVVVLHPAAAGEAPVGLATLAVAADHVEVLLAGMARHAQGRGWYSMLMHHVARAAEERGVGEVVISTQVHNVRVQRAWVRAGLRPFAAVETAHALASPLPPG